MELIFHLINLHAAAEPDKDALEATSELLVDRLAILQRKDQSQLSRRETAESNTLRFAVRIHELECETPMGKGCERLAALCVKLQNA